MLISLGERALWRRWEVKLANVQGLAAAEFRGSMVWAILGYPLRSEGLVSHRAPLLTKKNVQHLLGLSVFWGPYMHVGIRTSAACHTARKADRLERGRSRLVLAAGPGCCVGGLATGPSPLADPMASEISMVGQDAIAMWDLWKTPIR